MSVDNDDWDVQKAYQDDPKKAIFMLSSNIMQPDKLAGKVVKAINTQSDLQEALKNVNMRLITKDPDIRAAIATIFAEQIRKLYIDLIFNKKTLYGALATILIILGVKYEPFALIQHIMK